MHREGLGVARDKVKATALDTLAAKQTTKRFTVPSDFNGVKYPFYVYVMEWPADYKFSDGRPIEGIDDQITWLKEARGGTVASDVAESFRKLQRIARQNNVSFPDLAVYALGEAQKESAKAEAGTLASIISDLHKNLASPAPSVSTDISGVAIQGYDVVAYFTLGKPTPGSPEHYLIWNGAVWLFSSTQDQARFQTDPAKYAPMFGGFCSYCMASADKVHGDPAHWAMHGGRLYLHVSEDTREKWLKDPNRYISAADANWKKLSGIYVKPDEETALSNQISDVISKQNDAVLLEGRLGYIVNTLRQLTKDSPNDVKLNNKLTSVIRALALLHADHKDYRFAIALLEEAGERQRARYLATKSKQDRASYQDALGDLASVFDDIDDHAAAAAVDQTRIALLRMDATTDQNVWKTLEKVLSNLSWHSLFARQFAIAKAAADEAYRMDSADLVPATNAAHARMFLGDTAGARKIYLEHRGQKIQVYGRWESAVLADFAQFKTAKLGNPRLMYEIEAAFNTRH
jgi:YHS domain-containing protein